MRRGNTKEDGDFFPKRVPEAAIVSEALITGTDSLSAWAKGLQGHIPVAMTIRRR